jgi:serine/threonine protein kinase
MNRVQLFDRLSQGLSIREELEAKVDREGYEVSIKQYRVVEYLNKGAFGSVYKGFDVTEKRDVAIKLIDIDEMYAKNQSEEVR